jgi:hypothetical protein
MPRSSSARQQYSSDSIDVPIQTLGSGHELKALQLATRLRTFSHTGPASGSASSSDNRSISVQIASTNFCDAGSRRGRRGLLSTWNWCCGAGANVAKVLATHSIGTRAWPVSLMEFTNTFRDRRHRSGSNKASSCTVTPKPGPPVRGSPSRWYFAWPIALSRFAKVNA